MRIRIPCLEELEATLRPFRSLRRLGQTMETRKATLPNRKDIEGGGAQEVHTYFGCWLDINQETPEFEEDGEMKSVQEILKGEHQCLVAETQL